MSWLAVYAAGVGTLSLGWNIYRDFRRDRFSITVKASVSVVLTKGMDVVVTATNNGGTEEMVESIGIDYFDPTSDEPAGGLQGERKRVDKELPPHRNVSERFTFAGRLFQVGREYRGWIVLASGKLLTSGWKEFDRATLDLVGGAQWVINPRLISEAGEKLPSDPRRPPRNEGATSVFLGP